MLKELTQEDLAGLIRRALTDPRGFGQERLHYPEHMPEQLALFANGDARTALSAL